MRWLWLCGVVVACAGTTNPSAVRSWYVVENGSTLDGTPTSSSTLDISRSGPTVIILREGATNNALEGVGLADGDGRYAVAFFRRLPSNTEYPPQATNEDAMLFVAHRDGTASIAYPDRSHGALHAIARGTDLELTGPGDARTLIHHSDNAEATISGHFRAVHAVYAEFGETVVIAASARGESVDLSVGRYDLAHGRGENVGQHGRGLETFHVQSTTARD